MMAAAAYYLFSLDDDWRGIRLPGHSTTRSSPEGDTSSQGLMEG